MRSIGEKVGISLAIQGIIAGVFFLIETRRGPWAVRVPLWIHTPIDDRIPFVPDSVWIYASWYLMPIMLLGLDRHTFRQASAAVLGSFLLCSVGYVLLPIEVVRPAVEGSTVSTLLLGLIYGMDSPRNVFPSFHAALCAVVLSLVPASGAIRAALVVWMLAICAACVLTKQHYLVDVVVGLGVGYFVSRVVAAVFRPSLLTMAEQWPQRRYGN